MLLLETRENKFLTIKQMIEVEYIPVTITTIYWIQLKWQQTGLIINTWRKSGQLSIFTVAGLNTAIDLHMESQGKAINNAVIINILIESKEKTAEDNSI